MFLIVLSAISKYMQRLSASVLIKPMTLINIWFWVNSVVRLLFVVLLIGIIVLIT
ncbi:hypothetical protein [Clostridium saccharobutylicum]|uniref:hypothetical protein n=1 Tax=Clostridium saccharobutylicum TaxID=169679 RepID=UPI00156D48D4|nr:hypothetical protein [Clostridium saccharobutylicum]MBC2514613.1 hypothetical protein [Clostridium saccharobutylicum]